MRFNFLADGRNNWKQKCQHENKSSNGRKKSYSSHGLAIGRLVLVVRWLGGAQRGAVPAETGICALAIQWLRPDRYTHKEWLPQHHQLRRPIQASTLWCFCSPQQRCSKCGAVFILRCVHVCEEAPNACMIIFCGWCLKFEVFMLCMTT